MTSDRRLVSTCPGTASNRASVGVPVVRSLAVLAAALLFSACSSATIEKQDTRPRLKKVPGQSDFHWEERRGWVMPRHGQWGEEESIRAETSKAWTAEKYADALAGYRVLEERLPPGDPARLEIDFRIAECYYFLGDYENAVEYYRRVYTDKGASAENTQASHRRIYDIAMAYLQSAASCEFLGIAYDCPRHGIELLVGDKGLITEYPYLEYADDAIMEVAKYYYDEKQYPESVPFYERIVEEYCPNRSEWCELAEYQIAMAVYRQIRGIEYDQHLLLESERKFRGYLLSYPRGPHAEEAREYLRELSEMLAERYLRVAKFYLRESQPRSARIYLLKVLEVYTSTAAAREAREIQSRLDGAQESG